VVGCLVANARQIRAEEAGLVVDVRSTMGAKIVRGEALLRVLGPSAQAAVETAAAALQVAAADERRATLELERARDHSARRDLHPEVYPEEELASAHATVREAREAVEAAEGRKRDATARLLNERRADLRRTIMAPFDGWVAEVEVEAGAVVAPGTKLIRLVSNEPLRLRFGVRPLEVAAYHIGQTVSFFPDGTMTSVRATIDRLAPTVDPACQLVMVEAALDAEREIRGLQLRDGIAGTVRSASPP
jgi:multidrug resistance efflux pump